MRSVRQVSSAALPHYCNACGAPPGARLTYTGAIHLLPGETYTMTNFADPELNPGDEAKPGTPGAAEDICDGCSGSGKLADGTECPECGGSGRVMRGIGGG